MCNKLYEKVKNLYEKVSKLINQNYKKYTICEGILFIILISLITEKLNEFLLFLIICGYFVILFKKSSIKMVKIERLILTLVFLYVLFKINPHPLFLILSVICILIFCNIFIKNKLSPESMIIIVLTIIILEVSHPILNPRVDILNIGDIYRGTIIDEKTYGTQYITLSISPPLAPFFCTKIFLGYDVRYINYDRYLPPSVIIYPQLPGEPTKICTKLIGFTKQVIKLEVMSRQPIHYKIYNQNLSRFYGLGDEDNETRVREVSFHNYESFPILIYNASFIINNKSMLNSRINLWNFLNNDSEKLECRLNNFRFSNEKGSKWGDKGYYEKEDNKIILKFPVNIHLQPYNYTVGYIKFDPYVCD